MDMPWLAVILCIWINLKFDGASGEYMPHLWHDSCEPSCEDSGAENYYLTRKQLESNRQSQSRDSEVEHLFRYGNLLNCPVARAQTVDSDEPTWPAPMAQVEEGDDNDANEEVVVNGDDSEDEKIDETRTAERVACLLSALKESTKALCVNFRKLNAGLAGYKQGNENSSHRRTKFNRWTTTDAMPQSMNLRKRVHDKQKLYTSIRDNFHSKANAALNLKTRSNSKTYWSEKHRQLQLKKEKQMRAKAIAEQLKSVNAPIKETRLPILVPSTRQVVPSLLQLISQRTAMSIRKPHLRENSRFMQVLNAMRLSRAVQAAVATRCKQRHDRFALQQHVKHFKSNLQQIISNQAALAKRLSSLLTAIPT